MMLLGIDVGTSSVKSVILTTRGMIVDTLRVPLIRTRQESGISTQDSAEWIESIVSSLGLAAAQNAPLTAVGICFNCSSLVPSHGPDFCPIDDAILWNDRQSESASREINETLLHRQTPVRVRTDEPISRYLAFKDKYEAMGISLSFPEVATWILKRLTAETALPSSIFAGRWGILARAELRALVWDEFPTLKPIFDRSFTPTYGWDQQVGQLTAEFISKAALRKPVPVFSSGNDGITALFGSGYLPIAAADFAIAGTSRLYLAGQGKTDHALCDLSPFDYIRDVDTLFGRSFALYNLDDLKTRLHYTPDNRSLRPASEGSDSTICLLGGGFDPRAVHQCVTGSHIVTCGVFAGAAGAAAFAGMAAGHLPSDFIETSKLLRLNWEKIDNDG